jgi:hypothetical protein
MNAPLFHPGDFVIMSPARAASLHDEEMPGDRFHLVRVLKDKGDNFDFELVESGPCALVEALAIMGLPRDRRIWFTADHGQTPPRHCVDDE